ncbi:class I SAM-dependent methyltransferase [Paenibacillus sp. D51F]
MGDRVKQQFDAVSSRYDAQRRMLIPCFDDFYGMAAWAADSDAAEPRILDLGAGTGLMSSFMRQRYPKAHITLTDFTASMLDKARERFAGDGRVDFVQADMTGELPEGPYDLIVSSLAIHHLRHEDKRLLFGSVKARLEEGGRFVNADQAAAESALFDQLNREQWLKDIYDGRLAAEEADASVLRREVDINAKVSEQLLWLAEAGFSSVDCVYKYRDFAVFCAVK